MGACEEGAGGRAPAADPAGSPPSRCARAQGAPRGRRRPLRELQGRGPTPQPVYSNLGSLAQASLDEEEEYTVAGC